MPALISLMIVGVAAWMLCDLFYIAAKSATLVADQAKAFSESYNRQKDILLLTLGFLGTVTGYYLGRVPSERAADKADHRAAKAEENAADAKKQANAAHAANASNKIKVKNALNKLKPQPQPQDHELLSSEAGDSAIRDLEEIISTWE
jgi:hypothetical protein